MLSEGGEVSMAKPPMIHLQSKDDWASEWRGASTPNQARVALHLLALRMSPALRPPCSDDDPGLGMPLPTGLIPKHAVAAIIYLIATSGSLELHHRLRAPCGLVRARAFDVFQLDTPQWFHLQPKLPSDRSIAQAAGS